MLFSVTFTLLLSIPLNHPDRVYILDEDAILESSKTISSFHQNHLLRSRSSNTKSANAGSDDLQEA